MMMHGLTNFKFKVTNGILFSKELTVF